MTSVGILSVLVGVLALHALAGGRLLSRAGWGTMDATEKLTASWLIGLVSYHGIPVMLGWITGIMTGWWLAAGCGVALAYLSPSLVGGWTLLRSGLSRTTLQSPLARRDLTRRGAQLLPALLLLIVALQLGHTAARLPVRTYDAVTYHVVNPMMWWNTGRFDLSAFGPPAADPSETQAETFPNAKGVTVYLALCLQPDGRGTALAQWPHVILLILATTCLARRIGFRGAWCVLPAAVTLMAPEVLLQSVEAYADVVMLASLVSALWALWLLFDERMCESCGNATYVVAGCAMGWVLAAKPTGLLLAPVLLAMGAMLLLILNQLINRRKADYRTIPLNLYRFLAAAFVASWVLAAPWYLRGLFHYGNPIYPIRYSILGWSFPGEFSSGINAAMMEQYSGMRGLAAWWNTLMETPRPAALSSWTGGLGAPTAMLGLPVLLGALAEGILRIRSSCTQELRRGVLTMLLCIALTLLVPGAGVARFALLLVVGWALLLPTVLRAYPVWCRGVILLILFCGLGYDALRVSASIYYQQRAPAMVEFALADLDGGVAREDRWLGDVGTRTVLREGLLRREGLVLAARDLRPWLVQPSIPRGRWFRRLGPSPAGESPADFVARVRALGATYVYATLGSPEQRLAEAALGSGAVVVQRAESSAEHRLGPQPEPAAAVYSLTPDQSRAKQ